MAPYGEVGSCGMGERGNPSKQSTNHTLYRAVLAPRGANLVVITWHHPLDPRTLVSHVECSSTRDISS